MFLDRLLISDPALSESLLVPALPEDLADPRRRSGLEGRWHRNWLRLLQGRVLPGRYNWCLLQRRESDHRIAGQRGGEHILQRRHRPLKVLVHRRDLVRPALRVKPPALFLVSGHGALKCRSRQLGLAPCLPLDACLSRLLARGLTLHLPIYRDERTAAGPFNASHLQRS